MCAKIWRKALVRNEGSKWRKMLREREEKQLEDSRKEAAGSKGRRQRGRLAGSCSAQADWVSAAGIMEETAGSRGFIFTLLYITLPSYTRKQAHTHARPRNQYSASHPRTVSALRGGYKNTQNPWTTFTYFFTVTKQEHRYWMILQSPKLHSMVTSDFKNPLFLRFLPKEAWHQFSQRTFHNPTSFEIGLYNTHKEKLYWYENIQTLAD